MVPFINKLITWRRMVWGERDLQYWSLDL